MQFATNLLWQNISLLWNERNEPSVCPNIEDYFLASVNQFIFWSLAQYNKNKILLSNRFGFVGCTTSILQVLQKLHNKIIFKIVQVIISDVRIAKIEQSFSHARTLIKVLTPYQKRLYTLWTPSKKLHVAVFQKKALLLIYRGEIGLWIKQVLYR